MYALCNRHCIPSIFFSLTPCDECSFRVRLWVNAGQQFELESLSCTENACIADFKLRRKARQKYPGACSLEYQSIVQIVIKALFGWDTNTQTGGVGIFGKLIAFAVAHEEQGMFWTKFFICHPAFSNINLVRSCRSQNTTWPLASLD